MELSLEEYLSIERNIVDLYDIKIDGIPFWRIVRTRFRWKLLRKSAITTPPQISMVDVIYNNFKSLVGLLKLRLSNKKVSNIFIPHPRLFYVCGKYMERLTDPLIDYSGIGDDYIILERHQNGTHKRPRYHQEKVVYLDIIDTISKIFGKVYKKHVAQKYKGEIKQLLSILESAFGIEKSAYKPLFINLLTEFLISKSLTTPVLKSLRPQRVFLAPRTTFYHIIAFCKKHGVKSIELEHGITVGETMLYSGEYCEEIDPDYFFVFGRDNIGPQFYMPLDKVMNIGFPYKNYIKDIALEPFSENTVLVASEPTISAKIVDSLSVLGKEYPQCEFHIRCHPQERMSPELITRIDALPNVKIVPNTIESFCALSQYTNVMSENSSVLYEAMSLGKKVARLNFAGLHVKESNLIHGGTIINSPEDFRTFLNEPYNNANDSKELYSDYQPETFMKIL